MDILVNNPISSMYGRDFLVLYAGFIAYVATKAESVLKGDNTTTEAIPSNPDPYQIAYLRDGEKAVIKLACAELLQRGLIEEKENRIENITDSGIDLDRLSPIEKAVYDYVVTPRTVTALSNSLSLKNEIALLCKSDRHFLIERGHLNSTIKRYVVGGVGAFTILSLGSYKMISALSRGHYNILFLLIMAIAGTFWLWIISHSSYSRQTIKGRGYLADLGQAFGNLHGELTSPPTEPDYNTSLLVALYDLEILKKTSIEAYASLINLFLVKKPVTRSRRSSSSNSSYGCSGYNCSSSCGSSCGGGCGGCGGCGG